jgi:transcriptional regulator with XRE-family HTH domain
VISTLLKNIMVAQGLTQKEMAEVLNTSVDRIKSLATGRTKNFTIEESQILVKNLGIRAEWLITGEGDMYLENQLPGNLTLDEEMLLDAYRQANVLEKKKILGFAFGKKETTTSVVNQPAHAGSGDQLNAKKQKVDKRSRVNNFNGGFGGDYVEGDKNNH